MTKSISLKERLKTIAYRKYREKYGPVLEDVFSDSDSLNDIDRYVYPNMARILYDVKIIEKYIIDSNTKILEVGGNPPVLSSILSSKGYENLTSIDPQVDIYQNYFRRHDIAFFNYSLFDSVPENEQEVYDIVCCCEVIEHLPGDILVVLRNLVSFLKPGGLLYLTTPNLRSLSGLISLLFFNSALASKPTETLADQYLLKENKGYYGHVREFTSKEVRDLMTLCGMEHERSFFQSDYRLRPRNKIVGTIESMIPPFRLFGKYVFQKPVTL